MNPLGGYYTAFLAGSFVRRMLGYGCVVYGFEVLRGGHWSGVFYLALLCPYLLFSLHAGALIGSVSKRRLLQLTSASALGVLVVLFTSEWRGWFPAVEARGAWIVAVLFVYGAAYSLAYPTFIAAIPELVPPERVARTTVMINLLAILSMAYAPLAIGLLRERLSWPGVFGTLALLSAVSWLALNTAALPGAASTQRLTEGARIGALLRHCAAHPRLPALLWLIVLFNALAVGPLEVLLPQYGEAHLGLGPFAAGALIATGGTGLLVGAFAALRLVRQPRLGRWLCGMGAAGSVLIVGMSFMPAAAAFPLLFAGGMMGGAFSSLCLAAVQANAYGPMRGGVIALASLAMGGVPALGGLGAGILSAQAGVVLTLRICSGLAAVLFAATLLRSRALRNGDWGARS